MEIKTTGQIIRKMAENTPKQNNDYYNQEWVRVDDELIDLVKDVIVYYNKEYQKHPFNKTHQKCMSALKLLDELSQSSPDVNLQVKAKSDDKLKVDSGRDTLKD